MILSRFLRPRGDAGWQDVADDPTVAHLRRAVASELPDASRRVERRRGLVLAEFAASTTGVLTPARAVSWRERVPRRLAPAAVAATLVLAVTAGGIAASGPGLPAYPLRLAVEELLLPAAADARLTAQIERLERRLDEAAAATGNRAGLAAALEAYERIAEQVAASQPEARADAALRPRIAAQVRRLERLQPSAAGSGDALRSARRLLVWMGADERNGPGAGPGGAPSPAAEPSASSSPTPRPSPSHAPSPTPPSPAPASASPDDQGGDAGPSTEPEPSGPGGSSGGKGEPGRSGSGGGR